jgi:hypothetical protein
MKPLAARGQANFCWVLRTDRPVRKDAWVSNAGRTRGSAMERRDFLRAASATGGAGLAVPALLAGPGRRGRPARPRRPGTAQRPGWPPLAKLARQLSGRLLLPRSPGYAAENQPANDRFEHVTPVAIALCADARDVVTCVNWCRDYGVQPVARGGGHSYIGASSTFGLLIKTGAMNRVQADAGAAP